MPGSIIVISEGGGNKVDGEPVSGNVIGPVTSAEGFIVDNKDGAVAADVLHRVGTIEEFSSVDAHESASYGPGQLTVTLP